MRPEKSIFLWNCLKKSKFFGSFPRKSKYFGKLPKKIETLRKFTLKNRNFWWNYLKKTEIFRKFALKNRFFVCEIARKNLSKFFDPGSRPPRFQTRLTPLMWFHASTHMFDLWPLCYFNFATHFQATLSNEILTGFQFRFLTKPTKYLSTSISSSHHKTQKYNNLVHSSNIMTTPILTISRLYWL